MTTSAPSRASSSEATARTRPSRRLAADAARCRGAAGCAARTAGRWRPAWPAPGRSSAPPASARCRRRWRPRGPRRAPLCLRMVAQSSSAWVGCSWVPSPALITERIDVAGDERGRARGRVAHHDDVGAHRHQVARGVEQWSRPCWCEEVDAADVDRVGAHALGRDLERGAGPGRVLEEQVDDGAAAQGRHLLDGPLADLEEGLGQIQEVDDVGGVELGDAEQVAVGERPLFRTHDPASGPRTRTATRSTSPAPASRRNTLTDSSAPVVDRQAHVVGPDGQLAPAAVDQHGQLDRARPAVVHQRVERGPHGAAGEQDVVHQHHGGALELEGQLGGADHRPWQPGEHVVAVQGDVDGAERRAPALDALDELDQAGGQVQAAGADADQGQVRGAAVLLDDLAGDAPEHAPDRGAICQQAPLHQGGGSRARLARIHGLRIAEVAGPGQAGRRGHPARSGAGPARGPVGRGAIRLHWLACP